MTITQDTTLLRAVPLAQRLQLLQHTAVFTGLATSTLAELAEQMEPEHVPAHTIVVAEGTSGDAMYLVVEGRAEVTTRGATGPIPLATLEVGELFGEVALLLPEGTRQATVTALTPMLLLRLDRWQFEQLLVETPDLRANLARLAETVSIAIFLKRASPFTALDVPFLQQLATRVERHIVAAGDYILRQGEAGDTCYLLQQGRVEVLLRQEDGSERRIQMHGPGALFGEAALLTGAPRTASIRATEPCQLLLLHRADLLQTMHADLHVAMKVGELLHMHALPRRRDDVIVRQRTTSEGDTITTLKDARRGSYYRLSPQGWFLWQRLDGTHNLRDLTLEYFREFKAFAPGLVAEVVGGLLAAGFVEAPHVLADVQPSAASITGWQRAALFARRVLTAHTVLRDVDGFFTRWYDRGVYLCYTRLGQALIGLVCVAGLITFVVASGRVAGLVQQVPATLLWLLVPSYLIMILIHEAAHAFTVKAFGYEVLGVGGGWYWFGPFAYVDASDMWLAERWPRIAVSLAGPYSTLLVGCVAVLVSQLVASPVVTVTLWQFALLSFVAVLANLNPLLELDGYFVLVDVLERPNLRSKALAWIGQELGPALRRADGLRGHYVDLVYGVCSLLYTLTMTVVALITYRLYLQSWLAALISLPIASMLAWVVCIGVMVLSLLAIAGELRSVRSRSRVG